MDPYLSPPILESEAHYHSENLTCVPCIILMLIIMCKMMLFSPENYIYSTFFLISCFEHLDSGLCVCVYIFISSYCVSVHIINICEQQQISYISLYCCERSLWPKVTKFVLRYPRCKQNKTSLLCRVNSGTFKVHGQTARFSFICLL